MADRQNDATEHHGADAFNSLAPTHERMPSAETKDGAIDKEKLRDQIERQKEMSREDDEELKREHDKLG